MSKKSRLELIYGKKGLEKIQNSKILIAGLGGVGSYAAEAIGRSFVNNIILIDFDTFEESNLNRQLHSNDLTIGKNKVDIIKENILKINSEATITAYKDKISNENIIDLIPKDINYVIDAIDDFNAKVSLIEYCYKNNINIISSMGTAKKKNPEKLQYSDIFKTKICPLAKKIRKELKLRNVKKLNVVYSTEEIIKNNKSNILGSTPFVPAASGLMLAAYVINSIAEDYIS